ncbi:protein of unknown function (plasmid) [Caballeronia sp. S22]
MREPWDFRVEEVTDFRFAWRVDIWGKRSESWTDNAVSVAKRLMPMQGRGLRAKWCPQG